MPIHLRIVHGRPEGKRLELAEGEHIVGHGPECHIQPKSAWVSRQHCLIRVRGEEVAIQDLGSSNGTLINGRRIELEQPLHNGDRLEIGPLVFELEMEEPQQDPEPNGICSVG